MANLIVKAITRPARFNALEYALLAYIATESNVDGLFQQPASKITDTIEVGERAIQKTLRGLVSTAHLIEVEPRRRDDVSKFWIPAIYRLARPANKVADLRTDSRQTCEPPAPSPANPQQVDPTVHKFADETKGLTDRPANFYAQNLPTVNRTIEGSGNEVGIGLGQQATYTGVRAESVSDTTTVPAIDSLPISKNTVTFAVLADQKQRRHERIDQLVGTIATEVSYRQFPTLDDRESDEYERWCAEAEILIRPMVTELVDSGQLDRAITEYLTANLVVAAEGMVASA